CRREWIVNPAYNFAARGLVDALTHQHKVNEAALFARKYFEVFSHLWAYEIYVDALFDIGEQDIAWRYTKDSNQQKMNAGTYFYLAQKLLKSEHADQAMSVLEDNLKNSSDTPYWQYNAGVIQMQMGKADAALGY